MPSFLARANGFPGQREEKADGMAAPAAHITAEHSCSRGNAPSICDHAINPHFPNQPHHRRRHYPTYSVVLIFEAGSLGASIYDIRTEGGEGGVPSKADITR